MAEPFIRPKFEILDRLSSLSAIKASTQMFASDHPEDLDVHDMWGGMINIRCQTVPD